MVGNDIIDLNLADRHAWKRKRYLDKVFTASEQRLIQNSNDPGTLLWILWSMKESAYKLHVREHFYQALNPTKFLCFFDQELEFASGDSSQGRVEGRVRAGDQVFLTNTIFNQDCIHTLALINSRVKIQGDMMSGDCPNQLREKLVEALVESCSTPSDLTCNEVKFHKDKNGIPFVTDEKRSFSKACSISHHGKFGAFAVVV